MCEKLKPRLTMMKVDVIIVLGADVLTGGKPSPSLYRRVLKSVELYQLDAAKYILMTGGVGKHPPSEASIMKKIAVDNGVYEHNIILDELSLTTYENTINCIAIMDKNEWRNAIVVSDSYHLIRSILLFRAFGKSVIGIAPDKGRGDTKRSKWIYYHLREFAAIPWYLIKFASYRLKLLLKNR